MADIAFLFPGQGAQAVGMGKALYENYSTARQLMDQVNQWVLPDLCQVMFEGPEDTLKRTRYTQPAILAVSLAAYTVLQEHTKITPKVAAGHSLGEYAALYAAGVLSLEAVVMLVNKRAECMESAPAGAMAAVLSLPQEQVEGAVKAAADMGIVTVANYNTPDQVVISGEPAAVEKASALAKEQGAKVIPLVVGGAFHSPLMQGPADVFRNALATVTFVDGEFPVITNVDAQPTTKAIQFQEKLARQIPSSVRWTETMVRMKEQGIDTYVEIGPGKVLAGMVKKFHREATVYNVFDEASLAKTVDGLKERILV